MTPGQLRALLEKATPMLTELWPKGAPYRVGLEFDLDRKDRFNRTLAYIHDKDFPGRTFNWVLVRRGFGTAKHYAPNFKYRAMLDEAQRKAAAENRGLWGACGGQA